MCRRSAPRRHHPPIRDRTFVLTPWSRGTVASSSSAPARPRTLRRAPRWRRTSARSGHRRTCWRCPRRAAGPQVGVEDAHRLDVGDRPPELHRPEDHGRDLQPGRAEAAAPLDRVRDRAAAPAATACQKAAMTWPPLMATVWPGDVRRLGGRQEAHQLGDLLRLGPATERDGPAVLLDLRGPVVVAHPGRHAAGSDGVHQDAVRPDLHRQVLREARSSAPFAAQ